MTKRGFTLIELLVYMALIGIIVIIAGQAFSDSTKMRIRTQSMMKANQIAESVGLLLKDDIGQMGAKRSKENLTYTSDNFLTAYDTYIDNTNPDPSLQDYSSFILKSSTSDSLYFLREHYSDNGTFESVEAISWYIHDGKLWRSCKTKIKLSSVEENPDCPSNEAQDILIAEQVSKFKITPAKPGLLEASTDKVLYPPSTNKNVFRLIPRFGGERHYRSTVSPKEGGESVTISDIVSNFDENQVGAGNHGVNELYASEQNGTDGDWSDLCTGMTLEPSERYVISFIMNRSSETDASQSFVPGKDLLSVGFRNKEGATIGLPDFTFYPASSAESGSQKRIFNFSVSEKKENVCLVISIAAYTPSFSAGTLNIGNLQLYKISDENYDFDDSYVPALADKKNVKAFKVELQVQANNETGYTNLVIPVPSNGADYE